MEGNARTRFTPKQRAELWDRWKNGQCVADIARALERRNKSGVYRVLAFNGGIAPAARRRATLALALEEREEISRGIAAGRSIRRIAAILGRADRVQMCRSTRKLSGLSSVPAAIPRNPGRSSVVWVTVAPQTFNPFRILLRL